MKGSAEIPALVFLPTVSDPITPQELDAVMDGLVERLLARGLSPAEVEEWLMDSIFQAWPEEE